RAERRVPGRDGRVGRGRVPGRLTPGTPAGEPRGPQTPRVNTTIGEPLGDLHGRPAERVYESPRPTRAGDREQPQLPVARPAVPEEREHRLRVGATGAVGLGHNLLLLLTGPGSGPPT